MGRCSHGSGTSGMPWPFSPRSARELRPLLALAGLGLAAACSSPRAAVWNLDGLMDGATSCGTWCPYGTPGITGRDLIPGRADVDPEAVGDPSMRALEELLVLALRAHHARGELEAVRVLARYAGACPGRLARERAASASCPTPCGLRSRDRGVLPRNRLLQQPSRARSSDQGSVGGGLGPGRRTATALRDLRLDLEAATRLLGAYAALLKSSGGGPALTEPLWEEGRRVQGVAIALALGAALDDRDPWSARPRSKLAPASGACRSCSRP